MTDSLGQHMKLAQAGDEAAYRAVLTYGQKWLRAYFARRLNPSVVDDLVQDTLMSLHRKRHTYDPAQPFMPWLATIARYRMIDHLRKTSRLNETAMEDDVQFAAATQDASAAHDVDVLLARLPQGQANVIRLVKMQGYSMDEAAQATNTTAGAVKVMVHRAMNRLSLLAREDDKS